MNSFFLSDFLILSEKFTPTYDLVPSLAIHLELRYHLYMSFFILEITNRRNTVEVILSNLNCHLMLKRKMFLCLIRIRRLNSIKIIRSSDQKLIIFIRTHVNCLIKFKKDFSLNKQTQLMKLFSLQSNIYNI